jgi:hypothetical protein
MICTDPSPDVARIQSAMDFRKKMWQNFRQKRWEEDVIEKPRPIIKKMKTFGLKISESRRRVEIPDELQELCANASPK